MPVQDVIFERLRAATKAELTAFARPLGVKLTLDREVDVLALSTEYRSAAGHTLANFARAEHELEYRAILEDVVGAASRHAGWTKVTPKEVGDPAWVIWLEEYIVRALAFAAIPEKEKLSKEECLRAQQEAERMLEGHVEPQPWGTAFVIGAAAVVVPGSGAAVIAYALMGPALKKTVPATAVLIHVRKRLELEACLVVGGSARYDSLDTSA